MVDDRCSVKDGRDRPVTEEEDHDEHRECAGCDDPIRHDEKVVEIIFGFNSHGSLIASGDTEPVTCHDEITCIMEVVE